MLLALACSNLSAQSTSLDQEISQAIKAPNAVVQIGTDLFGDKVNLFTGSLEFVQTDVSLPGNNRLQVSVGRRIVTGATKARGRPFGTWDLDLPHLHGVFAKKNGWVTDIRRNNRCSNFSAPTAFHDSTSWEGQDFWQGNYIYVPGIGDQQMLLRAHANTKAPGPVSDYPVVTKDFWNFSCLATLKNDSTGGTLGEGFLATAPDGTAYRFDQMVSYDAPTITKGSGLAFLMHDSPAPEPSLKVGDTTDPAAAVGTASLSRVEVRLLPTQITDRFGNWVRYTYDPVLPGNLTSITSSDGRMISIRYGHPSDPKLITQMTDGTRTWNYTYSSYVYGGNDHFALDAVVLPDASTWQLGGIYPLIYKMGVAYGTDGCDAQFSPTSAPVGSMVHPTGATGTFSLQGQVHGRSDVPYACYLTPTGGRYNPKARYFYTLSLVAKSISGPGVDAMTWRYAYGPPNASWSPCEAPCPTSKSVSVTDPNGDVTRYTYGNRFRISEGRIEQVDYGWDGSSALRTVKTRYRPLGAGPYPVIAGYGGENLSDGEALARFMPVDQIETTQQDVVFTWTADAFDDMARVTHLTRSSSLGMSRAESTTYADNMANWVLGQVATVSELPSGRSMVVNSYHPTTANLTNVSRFGHSDVSMTYHADGTVATRSDGKNQATRFSNYKRGIPQDVSYPDGTGESAVVRNIGTISSMTNGAGFTTTFEDDSMGRLASIVHPAQDTVAWRPTTISFSMSASPMFDLPAGHWRQQIATGQAYTVNYLDALWRVAYTEKWDAADAAGTMRIVKHKYDFDGRTKYDSYPKRSYGEIGDGIAYRHDALGRQTASAADSELGKLLTSNSYNSGFRKATVDARGIATEYSYQVFDAPSEEAITNIAAPEGVNVSIARDVFGKPLSITRSGDDGKSATRSYVYDAYQRLCKTVEPETGATVQDYDLANNISWRASGVGLPSITSCDTASVPADRKISYGYDEQNRLRSTAFSDGSPAITRTYTADGLPDTITSNGAVWTNGYNKRRLNERESMAYGGVTYNIDRTYDANGSLLQLKYPDNSTVGYNPNALGEPRQIGAYANAIAFHPNGAIASFGHGSTAGGIAHSTTQNVRGLPWLASDTGVIDDEYTYDANANVTGIVDRLQPGASSRAMAYDNLDRLQTVSAPGLWGSAAYAYDALDNLTSTTITGGPTARSTIHTINPATNQLDSISNGPHGYNFTYAYDTQGNIIRRGTQAYVFDQGNRMRSATGTATYGYDGLGHRMTVVGTDGVNRVQVYSQGGQLLYTAPSGGIATKYIYLRNHVLAEVNGAAVTYLHTDALGSPVARSGAGAKAEPTRYEAYGHIAKGSPKTIGFTGHVNDIDTGLVYMQQRYYDPIAGRMLSIDPVTTDANTGGSFNRYSYANHSPYKYIDPDGRAVESVTMDKNKNVHIVVGMSYKGAVTTKQVDAFNAAIVGAYSGKKGEYTVNVTIIPSEQAKLGNYVTVVDGTKQSSSAGVGARETTLYTKDPAGATKEQVMVHEFGHLAGARDQYYSDGTPKAGYENNVMGSAKSGTVDERTIKEILDRNPPKEPKQQ
jgi:RHS repeat-associated protein